jgi:hypothetical protein
MAEAGRGLDPQRDLDAPRGKAARIPREWSSVGRASVRPRNGRWISRPVDRFRLPAWPPANRVRAPTAGSHSSLCLASPWAPVRLAGSTQQHSDNFLSIRVPQASSARRPHARRGAWPIRVAPMSSSFGPTARPWPAGTCGTSPMSKRRGWDVCGSKVLARRRGSLWTASVPVPSPTSNQPRNRPAPTARSGHSDSGDGTWSRPRSR